MLRVGLASWSAAVPSDRQLLPLPLTAGQGKLTLPPFTTEAGTDGLATAQLSGGVVLVVDDEDLVRRFMTRILTGAGFRVVQAHDGEEAATCLQALGAETIGLVVSDITMPRLNGLQLAALMSVHWPAVPTPGVRAGRPTDGVPGSLLKKPFEPDTLLAAVSRLVPVGTGT